MQSFYLWLDRLTPTDITILIICAIIAVLVIHLLVQIKNTPLGYEDETGFHYGQQNKQVQNLVDELAKYSVELSRVTKEFAEVSVNLATERCLNLELRESNKALKKEIAELAESRLQKKVEELEERLINQDLIIEKMAKDNTNLITKNTEQEDKINSLNTEILLREKVA